MKITTVSQLITVTNENRNRRQFHPGVSDAFLPVLYFLRLLLLAAALVMPKKKCESQLHFGKCITEIEGQSPVVSIYYFAV